MGTMKNQLAKLIEMESWLDRIDRSGKI